MVIRQVVSHRYRYSPPFPWRGPRPVVEATRVSEMTTFSYGNRTVALDAGEWLLESSDGGLITMSDATFRKWYDPVDMAAAAAMSEDGDRGFRRAHRRPHRRKAGRRNKPHA